MRLSRGRLNAREGYMCRSRKGVNAICPHRCIRSRQTDTGKALQTFQVVSQLSSADPRWMYPPTWNRGSEPRPQVAPGFCAGGSGIASQALWACCSRLLIQSCHSPVVLLVSRFPDMQETACHRFILSHLQSPSPLTTYQLLMQ